MRVGWNQGNFILVKISPYIKHESVSSIYLSHSFALCLALLCLPHCKSDGNVGSGYPPVPPIPPEPTCAMTPAGKGTEACPYLISTYEQLKKIKYGLDKHYELRNNIDASPSYEEGADGCIAYDGRNADTADCAGWIPIGEDSTPFTGSLDGREYVISKLYVNVSSDNEDAYAGLFGSIWTASIRNLGLRELRVMANSSGNFASAYAGGLAGHNNGGTIINSYAIAGSVEASSSGIIAVAAGGGGLVGSNLRGTIIINSYATGFVKVSASGRLVVVAGGGGLVGSEDSGTIMNSYATGSVEASSSGLTSSANSGGLVGYGHNETISNSYATGSVVTTVTTIKDGDTQASAGGLVGGTYNGMISHSYATGSVAATNIGDGDTYAYVGGLVGDNSDGTIDNTNYYDTSPTTGTGLEDACGSGSGTCDAVGLTTAEMQEDPSAGGIYPDMLGGVFLLSSGSYPKVYQCEINPMTNVCSDTFLDELVPGQ